MLDRILDLKDEMRKKDIQGMIVSNPKNIKYLTELTAEGLLLIDKKDNIFLTDSRYIEEVKKQITVEDNISAINISELSKYDYENFFILCDNVGIEENYITYAKYQNYLQLYQTNLVETEEMIEKIRQIKDEKEIELIRKACKITDDSFEYIIKYIKPGMTEKRIAFEIEKFMRMNGADGIAFDFCVASGPNSSMPHATPTDRQIQENDILLIDIGCSVGGYASDFTRTIVLGKASQEFRKEYNFVLEQQAKIIEKLKPMQDIKYIMQQSYLDYSEAKKEILHAFGHGLGLDIHEGPVLSINRQDKIKSNMVLAVEPGIYIPNKFGIRIEDTVLIKDKENEVLTKSNRNLIELELV